MTRPRTAAGRAKAGRRQVKLLAAVGMREDEAERRAEAEHREAVARIAAAGAAGVQAERRLAATLVWDAVLEALQAAGVARPCLSRAGAVFMGHHPNLRATPDDPTVRDESGRPLVGLVTTWIGSPAALAWLAGEIA